MRYAITMLISAFFISPGLQTRAQETGKEVLVDETLQGSHRQWYETQTIESHPDFKEMARTKWIVTFIERDGDTLPAQFGQKVGDVIDLQIPTTNFPPILM